MKRAQLESVTSEVVGNALMSIAEQMGMVLVRSAYSTNIKERKDCSSAVFGPKGRLVALAEHIPLHLSSMQGLVAEIARKSGIWCLRAGDVIIANDPYKGGGSHLPDITLVQPVFYERNMVAFVANIAHWSDVGGRLPGIGTAGDSTELLQEGLRIPPTRIISEGVIRTDNLDFILINMRNRTERLGDFHAQIASLRLGERKVMDLFKRYGTETINACIEEILDYSERQLKAAILNVPEGDYDFEDALDDDGITDNTLAIRVLVSISHEPEASICFDFSGTETQARGGINMVWSALLASVFYALKAILVPKVPLNAGFQRPIKIKAQEGSVVNAQEPAAVGGRADTCQRVVDTIMGAFGKVVPEKIVAASNGATTAIIIAGTKSMTGRDFVFVEALGGGMGAKFNRDGIDGIQVHMTNTSNLPIEAAELEYPIRILHYGLVPDSGGPGKFRGGLAIRKDIEFLRPVLFSAHSDRHRIPPWGVRGGLSGSCGKFVLDPDSPTERILPSKTSGIKIDRNQILRVFTAGGGGYGEPTLRNPQNAAVDRVSAKVSDRQLREIYGVEVSPQGEIDWRATQALRNRKRKGQ
ncbi:MAG: hydantoinase B/oxoprolinase family protein [Candidatus Thorarchaeota archaeon]